VLIGPGGGGMLYLTVSDLTPQAEGRHYQHSSTLSAALRFVIAFVVPGVV
jgi:zinc transporter ZupT